MSHSESYMIISPVPAEDSPIWGVVVQKYATVRKSLDGENCIVKWSGTKPGILPDGTVLDHTGILTEISSNPSTWG